MSDILLTALALTVVSTIMGTLIFVFIDYVYSKFFIQNKLNKEQKSTYKLWRKGYLYHYIILFFVTSGFPNFAKPLYSLTESLFINMFIYTILMIIILVKMNDRRKENKKRLKEIVGFNPLKDKVIASNFKNTQPKKVYNKPKKNSNTKECPKCAETIKAKAVICRFCKYNFETENFE